MHKLTRREFIFSSIAAATAAPLVGIASSEKNIDDADNWFEDIRADRYYVLQGGSYGDTGGMGCPGYELGFELIENMKCWDQCRYLEDNIESVEKHSFYLTPSTYFEEPQRQYDRIYLTKRWMMEFYNRHKNDDKKYWERRYDKYLRDVTSGKCRLDSNY